MNRVVAFRSGRLVSSPVNRRYLARIERLAHAHLDILSCCSTLLMAIGHVTPPVSSGRIGPTLPLEGAQMKQKKRALRDHVLAVRFIEVEFKMLRQLADDEERTLSATVRLLVREALQARASESHKSP